MRNIVIQVAILVLASIAGARIENARAGGPRPALMAALGDSQTAASLADTSLTLGAQPDGGFEGSHLQFFHWALNGILHGDALIQNKTTLSWSSGRDIRSHYRRLKRWLKLHDPEHARLKVVNYALPMETSSGLDRQVQRLSRELNTGRYSLLKYVTITMGANDACADHTSEVVPNEIFKQNMRKAFRSLASAARAQAEPVRVLLVSVPRIPDTAQRYIRESYTLGLLHCGWIRRNILSYCSRLTSWETPEQYDQLMGYVNDKNQALEELAHEASLDPELSSLDVHYAPSVARAEIRPEFLAVDCFHPDRDGQEMYSEALWQDQPWFR